MADKVGKKDPYKKGQIKTPVDFGAGGAKKSKPPVKTGR